MNVKYVGGVIIHDENKTCANKIESNSRALQKNRYRELQFYVQKLQLQISQDFGFHFEMAPEHDV